MANAKVNTLNSPGNGYRGVGTLLKHWGASETSSVDEKQMKICEDSGLESLLHLARMSHVKVQGLAMIVINSLREGDNGDIYIDSEEGFRPLVDLTKFAEEDVQREAVWSLAILASNSSCQARIEQEVGWHNFRKYAASSVPEIQAGTAILLGNLALEKTNQESLMLKGVPLLLSMLTATNDSKVRRAVVTALSNVSIIEGHGAKDVWLEKGIELMMPFIEQVDDMQLQIGALNTIANVCNHDKSTELKRKVAQLGGIGRLVPLLDSQDEMIVKLGAMTIANMASEDNHRNIMHGLHIEEPLIRLLDSRDEEIQLGVAMAINALADHELTRKEFLTRQAADPLKELIQVTKDRDIVKEAKEALKKISPNEYETLKKSISASFSSNSSDSEEDSYTHSSYVSGEHSRDESHSHDSGNSDSDSDSDTASESNGEAENKSKSILQREEAKRVEEQRRFREEQLRKQREEQEEEEKLNKDRESAQLPPQTSQEDESKSDERRSLNGGEIRARRRENGRRREDDSSGSSNEERSDSSTSDDEDGSRSGDDGDINENSPLSEEAKKRRDEELRLRRKEEARRRDSPSSDNSDSSEEEDNKEKVKEEILSEPERKKREEEARRREEEEDERNQRRKEIERKKREEEERRRKIEQEAFERREEIARMRREEEQDEPGPSPVNKSRNNRNSRSRSLSSSNSGLIVPKSPAKALVTILKQAHHQKGITRDALKELERYAARKEKEQLYYGEDIIAILVYIIYFYPDDEYPDVLILALYLLALLARYHVRNQLAIRKARGGEQIIRLLQSNVEPIRRNSALALGAYALNNKSVQSEVTRAIPLLARLLETQQIPSSTLRTVAACLASIADNNAINQQQVIASGGLRAAIKLIPVDKTFTRSCLRLVAATVSHNNSAQNSVSLDHPRFLGDLVAMTATEDALPYLDSIIHTLVELTKKNAGTQAGLYHVDAISKLVPLLQQVEAHGGEEDVEYKSNLQANVLYILLSLVRQSKGKGYGKKAKEDLIRLNVTPILQPLCAAKSRQLAETAMNLTKAIESR